jgi:DNA-binding transcriptional regulator YdaS (Cro superfamily)
MARKNILWISRHSLWSIQKVLLRSFHGKRCVIKQENIRFQNIDHYLDFLEQHHEEFFIYAVVPNKWKVVAKRLGYSVGTVNRPYSIRDQGKKKRIFTIEYAVGEIVKIKEMKKSFNTKGYRR